MISVAMTTYNGEKYLLAQLTSIIHQTQPVDEIIICDDRSSDNTVSVIENFINNNKSQVKIKLIKNIINLGYAENFKKAIRYTHGDYIFLSDQDDLWEPRKVEIMIRSMRESNADLLCSNYFLINQKGTKLEKLVAVPSYIQKAKPGLNKVKFFPLLFGNVAQGCTYCFTQEIREIYLKIDSRDLIHDYQLILIAAIRKNCFFINEKLIQYRIHENNSVGLPSQKEVKKIKFHLNYYVPKLGLFLQKVQPVLKVPCYYLVLAMIYFKIPVLYLVIKSYFSMIKIKL